MAVEDLLGRVSGVPETSPTYEALNFATADVASQTPKEASRTIAKQVFLGVAFGIMFPDKAGAMLENFVDQASDWKPLGVGGLRFDQSPLLTSTDQARELAKSVYHDWQATENSP